MKSYHYFLNSLLLIVLISYGMNSYGQTNKVPGIVVNYSPAKSSVYIGSPSICILPNGDYIASHGFFGPNSTEWECALKAVFKSSDKGKTWEKISEINGQFWSNIFVHKEALYIMGTWKHNGNFIIRRSTDNGKTWTNPKDKNSGLLLEGKYHTAPMPMIIHQGRIWRAIEYVVPYESEEETHLCPMVISAPVNADLLRAKSWKATNYLPFNSNYLNSTFKNWLEGNVVVSPEGKLLNILRVNTTETGKEVAAFVSVSKDGSSVSFDPEKDFTDFVGGATKFTIRFDKQSNLYWTICNMLDEEFKNKEASRVRNKLILKSSTDLKNWKINKVLLHHPDIKTHGFQYVDWQFEGNDIIYLSRTAYDDHLGGAHNFHDANYITFHRIKNFRE